MRKKREKERLREREEEHTECGESERKRGGEGEGARERGRERRVESKTREEKKESIATSDDEPLCRCSTAQLILARLVCRRRSDQRSCKEKEKNAKRRLNGGSN